MRLMFHVLPCSSTGSSKKLSIPVIWLYKTPGPRVSLAQWVSANSISGDQVHPPQMLT
jgi:hypothetical protein